MQLLALYTAAAPAAARRPTTTTPAAAVAPAAGLLQWDEARAVCGTNTGPAVLHWLVGD